MEIKILNANWIEFEDELKNQIYDGWTPKFESFCSDKRYNDYLYHIILTRGE